MSVFSISVVIPSYKRHKEVVRAVSSVLSQTLQPVQIVVCNDGPDAEKASLLESLNDPRIVYIEAPRRKSASATRNYGIQHVIGNWIALLDDDDVWLPKKLELQFDALISSGLEYAILAGRARIYKQGGGGLIRPSKLIPIDIPTDQALFCGYGGAHTSSLMAPDWLFRKYTFNEDIDRHEDWQWLIHAGQEAKLIVVPVVTCLRYLGENEGLSRPGGFLFSKNWYQTNKSIMSPEGRAGFVAGVLSRKAAYDHNLAALPWLIGECMVHAKIKPQYWVKLFMPWILTVNVRQRIKSMLERP